MFEEDFLGKTGPVVCVREALSREGKIDYQYYKINCELLVTVWELWSPWDPLVFDFCQSCELAPRQRAFAQDVPAREARYIDVFALL